MKCLVISPYSGEQVYTLWARSLAEGLNGIGGEGRTLILPERDLTPLVEALATWRPDAVVSFSSFFSTLRLPSGVSIYDAAGCRFVGWHLDHSLYASHLLTEAIEGRAAVFSSPSHLRFVEKAGWGGRRAVLLPGVDPPAGAAAPFREREPGVLLAAVWNGEPQPFWEAFSDSPARRLVEAYVEALLAREDASVLDAFEAASAALGLSGLSLDESLNNLLRLGLTYVRHRDRIRIVDDLAASGLPLTVVGAGWEGRLGVRRGLTCLDALPFGAVTALYGRHRVVVNLNAGNGGSERALNAAAAGAAVVSDFSEGLADALGSGVRFYSRGEAGGVAEAAATLMDTAVGEAAADEGRARALADATWRRRAEALCATLLTGEG